MAIQQSEFHTCYRKSCAAKFDDWGKLRADPVAVTTALLAGRLHRYAMRTDRGAPSNADARREARAA